MASNKMLPLGSEDGPPLYPRGPGSSALRCAGLRGRHFDHSDGTADVLDRFLRFFREGMRRNAQLLGELPAGQHLHPKALLGKNPLLLEDLRGDRRTVLEDLLEALEVD